MNTPPPPPLETPHHRLQRHAAYFRAAADLNMDAIRIAHTRLCRCAQDEQDHHNQAAKGETADHPRRPTPDPSKPASDLARATRGLITTVQAENALFAPANQASGQVPGQAPGQASARTPPQPTPRGPDDDPRRAPLREALHEAATDPNPTQRRQKRAAADHAVEQALLDDPHKQTPIYTHLKRIAAHLNITLVPAKLSDEVLGMPPRVYIRDD